MPSFFIFLFFHLSLQHNTYGNLCQRFLRNNCTQGFEIWCKSWVCLVVLCKRESASCCLPFSLFVHFSFSPIKFSVTDFFASMRARDFKFLVHLGSGQVYCGTENQDAEIYFYHLFLFFIFSISHSNVIHREICVKDFSGTTVPRILKFGTNVGYDLLYCVRETQHAAAYHSPYLSIFLSLQANFLLQIS